jgi:hypothetical protein
VDGDNVAIACRRLERGTLVAGTYKTFVLDFTVLEGHRFAVTRIEQGTALYSWGLPFGYAMRDIGIFPHYKRSDFSIEMMCPPRSCCVTAEGAYVINKGVLEALQGRHLDFELPHEPNFYDEIPLYELNRETFTPASPVRLLFFIASHESLDSYECYVRVRSSLVSRTDAPSWVTRGRLVAALELATTSLFFLPTPRPVTNSSDGWS